MLWLLFWVLMGVGVSVIAAYKGRDPLLWLLYGAVVWPLALPYVLLLDPE